MYEVFILKHIRGKKGKSITFSPFAQGMRKSKVIAIRIRGFFRDHISMTQYEEILKQFSKDLEIKDNKIVLKIR